MIQKYWQKYVNLSEPVKMSIWFLICSFFQKGIAMLTTPIFTRVMTEYEFGRYSIYNSWLFFFMALISLNIAGGYYMRGLVVNEDDRDVLTSSMLGLTATMCGISLVVYYIFSNVLNQITELNTFLFSIMVLQIFLSNTYYIWMNKQRVDYNYKPIVKITLLVTLLNPIVSVFAVLNADACLQVEARVLASVIIEIVLYSYLIAFLIKKGRKLYKRKYWQEAILFSLPLVPHYLSKIVLSQADRVMIGSYCGLEEVGYYSVAYSIAVIILIFNQAVSSSLDPWLYKSIKEKSFSSISDISIKILILMSLLNLSVIAFAPEVLKIFAPANFYTAVWVIPPITASVFFMFMYDLFTAFQYYYAKTKWIMLASLVGALLNIVLNSLFIPLFGFIAAGYTTLICYILFGMAHYFFMCKVCDKYLEGIRPYDIKKIICIGALVVAFAMMMILLYPYMLIRYALIFAIILLLYKKRKEITELMKGLKGK